MSIARGSEASNRGQPVSNHNDVIMSVAASSTDARTRHSSIFDDVPPTSVAPSSTAPSSPVADDDEDEDKSNKVRVESFR